MTEPAKVRAVAEWPVPATRKQIQCFLGFANFNQRFIRDYSKVPLTKLTSSKLPFVWSTETFSRLKTLFTTPPVLVHPDTMLPFVVVFSHFHFNISYPPGSKNVKPDTLSPQFSQDSDPSTPDCLLSVLLGALAGISNKPSSNIAQETAIQGRNPLSDATYLRLPKMCHSNHSTESYLPGTLGLMRLTPF